MNEYKAMTALVTPFKNGQIDEQGYERLIQRQIKNGIDAIVPVGTTGESATLTHEEHRTCIEIAISACKNSNCKVVAGAGSNSTDEAISLALFAQKSGAHAILSVTPYYNKPSQEGLYRHYSAIAKSVEIDVLLYDVPARTGLAIEVQTALRLYKDHKNIIGIKEANSDLARTVNFLSKEKDILIFCGDDAINFPMLASGAKGVISVSSNLVPDKISSLTHLALEGDFKASRQLNQELYELNSMLFQQSNPLPIKTAMYIAGLIDSLEFRLPLYPLAKENFDKIEKLIQKYDIKGF